MEVIGGSCFEIAFQSSTDKIGFICIFKSKRFKTSIIFV